MGRQHVCMGCRSPAMSTGSGLQTSPATSACALGAQPTRQHCLQKAWWWAPMKAEPLPASPSGTRTERTLPSGCGCRCSGIHLALARQPLMVVMPGEILCLSPKEGSRSILAQWQLTSLPTGQRPYGNRMSRGNAVVWSLDLSACVFAA